MADTTTNLGRSTHPAVDWQTFFEVVKKAYDLHVKTVGCPVGTAPLFIEDYPMDRIAASDSALDVILWSVEGSETASTAPRNNSRKPKGLWLAEVRKDPTMHGYNIVVNRWWETVTAQFTIYTSSNKRGNDLVNWFHRFMMAYGLGLQMFRSHGVEDFRFHRRLKDDFVSRFGQELYTRRLQYCFRLDVLSVFRSKQIEGIRVTVEGNPEVIKDFPENFVST